MHFYTLFSKDIDESCVCGTLDQALCQVGEDTTGAVFTELDHEGKYHTTLASVAIANKWLDRFGGEVEYDWQWEADVPAFIREYAGERVTEMQDKAFEASLGEREEAWAHRHSVGVSFGARS